jgi:hypothetical protein
VSLIDPPFCLASWSLVVACSTRGQFVLEECIGPADCEVEPIYIAHCDGHPARHLHVFGSLQVPGNYLSLLHDDKIRRIQGGKGGSPFPGDHVRSG